MTAKKSWSRSSYAAFRQSFVSINAFKKASRKFKVIFLVHKAARNLQTIHAWTEITYSVCVIGLLTNYSSGDPVLLRFLSQKTGPSLVVFLLEVGALSLDDIRGDQRGVAPDDYCNWGNWGLKEHIWKVSSLVGSLRSLCWPKSFCSALAALVGPVQNIIFLTVHYFTSFVPTVQQAGQAVVPRRLSPNMCLWWHLISL